MRVVIALALAGCAMAPPPPPAAARPDAPIGRLAGPPAALRSGVVQYPGLELPAPAPVHHHHP